jgi:hypothetical protein
MAVKVSIVVNDMNRTREASYGFRSWMLQRCDFEYEVVCVLFNDRRAEYEKLEQGKTKNASVVYDVHKPPKFFNISIANDLGLLAAQGEYIFFCNSDVIHPSDYLQRAVAEIEKRKLGYLTGARVNLREDFMRSVIKEPMTYSADRAYDADLVGLEWGTGAMTLWGSGTPWIVRREVALAVGGFDPDIVCYEERDFEDRVMHYLQKQGLQDVGFSFTSLYSYHIWHPRGELYDIGAESKRLIVRRREELRANKRAAHVQLLSREALLGKLYAAEPPPAPARPSVWRVLNSRIRQAASILVKGA